MTFEPNYHYILGNSVHSITTAIASTDVHLEDRCVKNRWTICLSITTAYSYSYDITWGFRRFLKREELAVLLFSHQSSSMKSN